MEASCTDISSVPPWHCFTTSWPVCYTFSSQLYKQNNRVVTGLSLSFVNSVGHMEELNNDKALDQATRRPLCWSRYVDNISSSGPLVQGSWTCSWSTWSDTRTFISSWRLSYMAAFPSLTLKRRPYGSLCHKIYQQATISLLWLTAPPSFLCEYTEP
jgi:hypothetical protein